MKIEKLSNEHKEATWQFLMKHAYSSMFLLNNIDKTGLNYTGELYSGEYWAAFDDKGEVKGVIAHFWNGNLMVQAPEQDALAALTTYFLKHANRPIAGMVGDGEQTLYVLDQLGLPNEAYITNRSEGLYQLALEDLQLPDKALAEHFKLIPTSAADTQLLFDWLKAYELEAFGGEPSEEHDEHIRNRVSQMQEGDFAWVLLNDGEPVSLSGFNATLPEIVQVGPVWTPPEHRNNGYARITVALTLTAARASGAQKSVLFTDHPAAAKAYEAIGFKENGSFHIALLKDAVEMSKEPTSA
ncbi:GNAT family N-acetyltransferase [Pseudovibrio denitrificans]|uniref:GNAT family N-acetyltransferase n=1 Tax=Pseudovibrio denitrificans TaxID=258256 RepID=UPI0039BF0EB9